MKKAIGAIFLFVILNLCFLFGVHAESEGYLVKFQEGFYPETERYGLRAVNAERGIYVAAELDALSEIETYIVHISPNGKVTLIEGRESISTFALPNDELYDEQWQWDMLQAEGGWNLESYGNDIKIAVIDSGCHAHEDLKNNLLEGKNYFDGSKDVEDDEGHGTHVAGIIAAEMNDIGIVGVAPQAKIVPLKCFAKNEITFTDDIVQAIYDAVDIYGCQIINMSWGMAYNDVFLEEAITYAAEKGVILVAAVGNYFSTKLYYPAAYDCVIGVSSVNAQKNKSIFAQKNTSVLVAAPGEQVKSTYLDGTYALLDGTSQAAPMISGIAAVALSVDENLTGAEFVKLLTETAEDLGTEGQDDSFGYGLVNEAALLEKMMQSIPCYVSPITLTNGEAKVLIKNNTSEPLSAVSLFAGYDGQAMTLCTQANVTLKADETKTVTQKMSGNKVVHFLWENMKTIVPVIGKRVMQK